MAKIYDHTFAMVALQARKRRETERLAPRPKVRLRAAIVKLRLEGYQGATDLRSLLDACGAKVDLLGQHLSNNPDKRWEARSSWLNKPVQEFGHTPEEAVVKLLTTLLHQHA